MQQECIPVGCVLTAAVAATLSRGGSLSKGRLCPTGVSVQGGLCLSGVSGENVDLLKPCEQND